MWLSTIFNEDGMKYTEVNVEFSHFLPERFDEGMLYISTDFGACCHLCFCGCGYPVSTPLNEGGWNLENRDGVVSLSPSVGSFQLPCKSHYFIKKNKVEWCD